MFINEIDSPEVLKTSVNGKPGFVLLPNGEDDDGIFFTSWLALERWVREVSEMAAVARHAQPYEEWLETGS